MYFLKKTSEGTGKDDCGKTDQHRFGNVVNSDKIIAVVSPEAAPVKRMVQRARKATASSMRRRKTHSSAHHRRRIYHPFGFAAETISRRFNGGWETEKSEGI